MSAVAVKERVGEAVVVVEGPSSRLYLRRGGIHHYSMQSFDVEAVLIKTLTMQAEWPCRNGRFEESVNAPFRGGGPEITASITISHSEASVTKCFFFLRFFFLKRVCV